MFAGDISRHLTTSGELPVQLLASTISVSVLASTSPSASRWVADLGRASKVVVAMDGRSEIPVAPAEDDVLHLQSVDVLLQQINVTLFRGDGGLESCDLLMQIGVVAVMIARGLV